MKNNADRSAARGILRVLCVLFFLILVALLVGSFYLDSFLDRIGRFDTDEVTLSHEEVQQILAETDPGEELTGETVDPDDISMPDGPADEISNEDHVINILLIGQDRREGQGRQRSDAMILCTVNPEKKTLTMTSFLRDMYVQYPEYNGKKYGSSRINSTYAIGGMKMLNDCLKLNFGVDVDHNIEVDFSGFEKIIDLIGGVDIELTQAEASWMDMGHKKGLNRLNGAAALEYARIRKLDSDFGRTNRQRTVLAAVLERVKDLPVSELTKLAEEAMPMITTDMTNAEIIKYVLELFPILSELSVTTQHIPAEGAYYNANINGMSVLVPDFEANIQILKDTIG